MDKYFEGVFSDVAAHMAFRKSNLSFNLVSYLLKGMILEDYFFQLLVCSVAELPVRTIAYMAYILYAKKTRIESSYAVCGRRRPSSAYAFQQNDQGLRSLLR